MRLTIYTATLLLLLTGCIKQTTVAIRNPTPQLVVEGLLLTDTTPCTVTLSYSGVFNSSGYQQPAFINDATVYVKKTGGDSVQLYNVGNGQYMSASSIYAKPGESYYLGITLADGKQYASVPEKIVPVPKDFSIDSFGVSQPYNLESLYGAAVLIKTQDPAGEKNFYRWISTDYVSRKATGVPCGINIPPCYQYCYQYYHDDNLYILSDANINGSQIRYQPALISPYYYYGRHFMVVKQLSLTAAAYQFWLLYQEQSTRTGGILDPLPAPIQGNIYNVNNPTELALGYFGASDAASIKFVLAPLFLNAYYTLAGAPNYIGEGACYLIYPNASNDPPPGWENAPEYIVNVY
jgi:hypothetical protein